MRNDHTTIQPIEIRYKEYPIESQKPSHLIGRTLTEISPYPSARIDMTDTLDLAITNNNEDSTSKSESSRDFQETNLKETYITIESYQHDLRHFYKCSWVVCGFWLSTISLVCLTIIVTTIVMNKLK